MRIANLDFSGVLHHEIDGEVVICKLLDLARCSIGDFLIRAGFQIGETRRPMLQRHEWEDGLSVLVAFRFTGPLP